MFLNGVLMCVEWLRLASLCVLLGFHLNSNYFRLWAILVVLGDYFFTCFYYI